MKKLIVIASILCLIVGVPLVKKFASDGGIKKVQTETLQNHAIKTSIIAS